MDGKNSEIRLGGGLLAFLHESLTVLCGACCDIFLLSSSSESSLVFSMCERANGQVLVSLIFLTSKETDRKILCKWKLRVKQKQINLKVDIS